jgi:hypothetical protein
MEDGDIAGAAALVRAKKDGGFGLGKAVGFGTLHHMLFRAPFQLAIDMAWWETLSHFTWFELQAKKPAVHDRVALMDAFGIVGAPDGPTQHFPKQFFDTIRFVDPPPPLPPAAAADLPPPVEEEELLLNLNDLLLVLNEKARGKMQRVNAKGQGAEGQVMPPRMRPQRWRPGARKGNSEVRRISSKCFWV